MKIFYLFLTLSLSVNTVSAQEDSSSTKQLDEVVVTGQYKPQSVKTSVYQVKIITSERIRKQAAARLQDVLNNELNIRFSQDPATGGSGITMLGMSGQNVKILVDGLPLVGRQGASNEVDINQIDVNTIERIEIVEGPMSVIYGADALAGVINIITKKSGPLKFSVTARLHEESVGKEYGVKQGIHNQFVGINGRHKKWEFGGSFSHNYFGGWQDTAVGRELVWHKKDQLLASGYVGYTAGKFNIRYRIDGLDEIITNPGNFLFYDRDYDQTFAFDQEYLSHRVMQQLQAGYFVNSQLAFQAQSSFTTYSRQVFSTTLSKETGEVALDPGEGKQSVVDFTGFVFRGTSIYKLNSIVSFQPGVDINLESGKGERLKTGNNSVNDYAFFITSEITPSTKVSIRPGVRFIKNSVYDAPGLIPSLNTRFAIAKSLDFRFSYARGFRSPSLRELYFDFFDANHNIVGNPDLKAETSHSFNASFSWKKTTPGEVAYTTVLGGFYNKVKDLIDFALSASDPNLFILTNVSNSKTAGINLSSVAKYKKWNITVGAAYTGFYNQYTETDKSLPQMQWSPEANLNFGYSITKIGLDLNLFYKFTGTRPRYISDGPDFVLSKTDAYHMADLTVNKKLFQYFSVSGGIRNLFGVDRVESSFPGGGVHTGGGLNIATGRSFFAGLGFNWGKK